MTQTGLDQRAVQEILWRVREQGPPKPRVVHCNEETEWDPESLRTLSEHELHVLGRAPDMVVFFDPDGNAIGWRDDGLRGSERPVEVQRDAFLEAMIEQLDLPEETRLGRARPAELPPYGWTQEGVLFLKPAAGPEDILRVWAVPQLLRVIQCLYDRSPYARSTP